MNNRILKHSLFWLVYTGIHAYLNASFPAKSDLAYAFPARLFRFWVTELMYLPVILLATYWILYWVFPKYFLHRQYGKALLSTVIPLFVFILLIRLITYYGVYPYLYQEYPDFEIISVRRFLYTFLDILPAIASMATIKLMLGRLESKKKEEQLEKEKLIAELQFLKSQTNPHFLFNTLNNIYGLARRKSDNTETAIMKLSSIMRFMLYECDKPYISLSQELKAVEDYIALESLRYSDQLSIRFNADLNGKDPQVAPLLLLPFVENAFKHGASESRHKSHINIEVALDENALTYKIQNSIEDEPEDDQQGIGLKNVQRQLELVYPGQHQLEIEKSTDQFTAKLRIDLNA